MLESHYVGSPSWTYEVPANIPSVITGASYIQRPGATAPKAGGWGWGGVLAGFCWGKGRRMRRVEGDDWGWGYPDVVFWNGSNYTDGRRGDFVYRDDAGNMLDLGL